jgi:ABC-type transporter Mla subunit MlaD
MVAPTTISSEKLEKILEVNSKAIEINTLVSVQYEKIIDELSKIKSTDDDRYKEIDELFDAVRDQHKVIIQSSQDLKKTSDELIAYIKGVKDVVDRIDRTLFKVSVGLVSSSAIITAAIQIIAKLYGH